MSSDTEWVSTLKNYVDRKRMFYLKWCLLLIGLQSIRPSNQLASLKGRVGI